MKLIDVDKLLQDIKKLGLESMKQADIIKYLANIINKQSTVSKNRLFFSATLTIILNLLSAE